MQFVREKLVRKRINAVRLSRAVTLV
uniref:Uncharacterized protein n=1 Tax=Anopheles arabiensis TaxID=7173 RepID=A0A182IGM1_ANOAR